MVGDNTAIKKNNLHNGVYKKVNKAKKKCKRQARSLQELIYFF